MVRRDLSALLSRPEPILMGVLNVTPDSFSDGGDFVLIDTALEHAMQMAADGAQIIDIGGESTRPAGKTYGKGAPHVPMEEELLRVIPVIGEIRSRLPDLLISIDTQKSYIAKAAIQNGADLINDVSAGTSDPEMFPFAASRNVPILLMHGHGPRFSKARIDDYSYANVVDDVKNYLVERIAVARAAGIKTILADVGIGFAKGYDDSFRLLKHHADFSPLKVPMVVGVSRKSSIGKAMGNDAAPKERVTGSIAAACYAFEHGAKIIRTHDVKETREALSVMQAILHS